MVDGLQLTETEVIADGEAGEVGEVGVPLGATRTVAVPVTLGCCALVAVTVTVPAVVGAVNTPAAEMEPALADQVTAELYDPEPCTEALHCAVPPPETDEGLQITETAVIAGLCDAGVASGVLPPQPAAKTATAHAVATHRKICIRICLKRIHPRGGVNPMLPDSPQPPRTRGIAEGLIGC